MRLLYTNSADGTQATLELTTRPVTIGRSLEADLVIQDELASRLHCGIRFEDETYHIKDLKSKNGTFLNDERVEYAELAPGDRIRVGSMVFRLEDVPAKGPNTVVMEVEEEMADGKGYRTILKEIVKDVEDTPNRNRRGIPGKKA